MITTQAWVIHQAEKKNGHPIPAELRHEIFSFPDIGSEEVLVEPIYGCWEGNMAHALTRSPVDICEQRREPRVVIGNAGVVRVDSTLCLNLLPFGCSQPSSFGSPSALCADG